MRRQQLVSPVLMWAIVVGGAVIAINAFPPYAVFPKNIITSVLIVPTAIYWLYFFIGAVRVHRQAVQGVAGVRRIIDTGVYNKVRHPIYPVRERCARGTTSVARSDFSLTGFTQRTSPLPGAYFSFGRI